MREVAECPVCGGRSFQPFAMASQSVLHWGQVRCRGCALLISQPQATAGELSEFYARTYYDELWSDPDLTPTEREYRRCELPLMKRLWADWPPPGRRAVEVGCGYGEMLRLLVED